MQTYRLRRDGGNAKHQMESTHAHTRTSYMRKITQIKKKNVRKEEEKEKNSYNDR